jgi:hypothetical protein
MVVNTVPLGTTVYNIDDIPMTSGIEHHASHEPNSSRDTIEDQVAESALARKKRMELEA